MSLDRGLGSEDVFVLRVRRRRNYLRFRSRISKIRREDISVIITARNAADTIGRALASIAALTKFFSLPWRFVLSTIKAPIPAGPAPGWLIAFLWLWVIVGSGAYVYRFQDLGLAAFEMLTRL